MTPAPKRRWFRFGLATMFVVIAALASWIGYGTNWIRQRHNALAIGGVEIADDPFASAPISVPAPGLLRLLGERGYSDLSFKCSRGDFELTPDEKNELDRLRRLFPEASFGFFWMPPLQPATPPNAEQPVKSQERPRNEYLRFPAEQDYQMDALPMGTERPGMR